jgi:hypothetical protein
VRESRGFYAFGFLRFLLAYCVREKRERRKYKRGRYGLSGFFTLLFFFFFALFLMRLKFLFSAYSRGAWLPTPHTRRIAVYISISF